MSWDVLVPVIIGGALTIGGGFLADVIRARRDDKREAERAARASLQATRIIAAELAESHQMIRTAVRTGEWWPTKRQLPTESWNRYRDLIAGDPDPMTWRLTANAFQALNDFNWAMRAEMSTVGAMLGPRRASSR